MTSRGDLLASVNAAVLDADALIGTLAQPIADSVRRHAEGGKVTAAARLRVLADVDAILDAVYGRERGGPSALADLVARHAASTRRKPVAEAVGVVRRRLDGQTALLRAMGDTGER